MNKNIGQFISLLYRYSQSNLTRELKKYNLGSGQCIFLISLYEEDSICQEELSQRLSIDKGTTARAIRKLEEQGYVTRTLRERGRRCYEISLTDKARQCEKEINLILNKWEQLLTHNLTKKEKSQLTTLMEKIKKNLLE